MVFGRVILRLGIVGLGRDRVVPHVLLRLVVDEMWRLQRQKVHPRELADAQAYLTGSFPLTIETPSAIALQVLNAVFYGLDLSELETFRERVNAVTPEDIQRVTA